jgi:hypothetical protein
MTYPINYEVFNHTPRLVQIPRRPIIHGYGSPAPGQIQHVAVPPLTITPIRPDTVSPNTRPTSAIRHSPNKINNY